MGKEDYKDYVIGLYDYYLDLVENRGISYGELNYLSNLKVSELKKIEKNIKDKLNEGEKRI